MASKRVSSTSSYAITFTFGLRKIMKTCGTMLEKQGQTNVTFFYGPLHKNLSVLTENND